MRNASIVVGACVMVASLSGGCATEADTRDGNDALGIARFDVEETADRTMVIGLDVAGREVGRLDLVHGAFTPRPEFADDFTTTIATGRSLDVNVADQSYVWQTEGEQADVMLPAMPPNYRQLGLFLADPHVVDALARWRIAFEPFRTTTTTLDGEKQYDWVADATWQYTGTGGTGCSDCATLGTVNSPPRTINTCGGTNAAFEAAKVLTGSEWKVLQTCRSGTGLKRDLLLKSCPVSGDNSSCGTSTGACKGCGILASGNPYTCVANVEVGWTTSMIQGTHYNWQGICP